MDSSEIRANNVSHNLLKFYAQRLSRKEYLDSVTQEISQWSGCRCVGIRLLNSQGYVPYESFIGFTPFFLEKENMLSIKEHACACIRVIKGEFSPADQSAVSPNGSFFCEDATRFISRLTENQKVSFRGTCIEAGFKCICITPIRYRNELMGAIHLADERESIISRKSVETLENIALIIGEAVFRYSLEKAFTDNEKKYSTLVENSPSGIYLVQDGKFVFTNHAFAQTHGYSRDELIGIESLETIHPTDRAFVEKMRRRRLEGEAVPTEYEARGVRKNGEAIWVQRRNVRIEYDGKPAILGYELDITERKESEYNLQEKNELLETIFSNVHFLVAYMDKNFNFIRVNRAYAEADGHPSEFFVGKNHFTLYPDAENERVFRKVVETGIPYLVYGKPFGYALNPERGKTYWDWSLQPIKDTAGLVKGVVLSLVDVTESKRAEETLRASERELRFLSERLLTAQEEERKTIARDLHDGIGQFLAVIKMQLEDMVGNFDRNPSGRESLKGVLTLSQKSIEEIRSIIANLRPPAIESRGVLSEISSFCAHLSRNSQITVREKHNLEEADIPDSLKLVIYRIFQEAVNNATKHSKADQIEVVLEKSDESIELQIEDNGIGFDICEALSRNELDQGIGLSSMRERAQLSGGTFSMDSKKGIGTKIRAVWPF